MSIGFRAEFHEMEEVNFSGLELVYHVRHTFGSVFLDDSDSHDQLIGVLHHEGRLYP